MRAISLIVLFAIEALLVYAFLFGTYHSSRLPSAWFQAREHPMDATAQRRYKEELSHNRTAKLAITTALGVLIVGNAVLLVKLVRKIANSPEAS